MTPRPSAGRLCSSTGLWLVKAGEEIAYRVAKSSYGSLNPPARPDSHEDDPTGWGRFDTRGGRTVYAADTRECALAEVLAYYRRKLGQRDSLAGDAAFLGLTADDLLADVDAEWAERGHMPPGHLAKGWRTERRLYTLEMPGQGWWVVMEHPATIAAAEKALGDQLASVGVTELDVAVLRGSNRKATVLLADWARAQTLDDGSRALGVRYESRHATGGAFAYWLRSINDGAELRHATIREVGYQPIEISDPDLVAVAERIGLTVW